MKKLRPRLEFLRRWRWPLAGAAAALAPKCLLCVAAYAGIGAALGLGGREMCGMPADGPAAMRVWLSGLGGVFVISSLALRRTSCQPIAAQRPTDA